MSSRREFLESFEGRKYQYWNRFVKNSIIISFEVEKFQTKRSKSIAENQKFQEYILTKLKEKKRSCFRGNVAVEFSFTINQKNSPAIQSLLKHYIDLIQKPSQNIKTKRKYLLIKDDSQIKALSAYYWKSDKKEKQELSITMRPIRDFLYNLEFAQEMQMEKFSENKIYSIHEDDDYEESKRRLEYLNDYEYDNFDSFKGITIEINGKQMDFSEFRKQMVEEERNQELLKVLSNLSASSVLSLIAEPETPKEGNSFLNIPLNKIGRVTTLNGLFNIDFGGVPVNEGDSKLFKEKVNKEIQEWKQKRGKRLPKNPSIALKFFYEKPERVNHDLDNLLRYVLPHFNELINKDRYFKHVTSIEIYQIQTISENSKTGNLYLRIEDFGNNNMFHITQRLMEKYE